MVTLEEAKLYLRVDGTEDDALIQEMLTAAKKLVQDITRQEDEAFDPDNEVVRIAILFAVAYLYEHRESGTHKALTLTLRSLLFGIRQIRF